MMDPLVKQLSKRPSILQMLSLSDDQPTAPHTTGTSAVSSTTHHQQQTTHRDTFISDYGKNDYGTSFKSSRDNDVSMTDYSSFNSSANNARNSSSKTQGFSYGGMYGDQKEKSSATRTVSKAQEDIEEFCKKTTAHGWGRVLQEKLTVLKVAWIFLTIFAYVCNALHISLLVEQFLGYPTEQVTRVELESVEFPSVTICNIQPISFTTGLEYLADSSSSLNYWERMTREYFLSEATENMTTEDREYLYNRLTQPSGYFENIGDEYREIGIQPRDFVLRCTFGIKDCVPENFTYFPSPTYYNCYTFNGGNYTVDSLTTRSTGPQNGLSLILYLESDNGDMLYNGTYHTLSNVANAAGARVVIHPPDSRPNPVDQGFDIPPGFSSSIGLRVTSYTRLGGNYGECVSDPMLSGTWYRYSTSACISQCQQFFIMDKCRCISASLPVPANTNNLTYCGKFNPELPQFFFDNLSCEANQLNLFADNETMRSSCGCYSPCEELAYSEEVSYSYWPLDFAQQSFYTSYVLNHENRDSMKAYTNLQHFNLTELISRNLIRKNFIRLNVFLRDLVISKVMQKQTYEVQNLLSDMGGTFGLWIGVSILSWFEIMELLLTVCYKSVLWVKRKVGAERPVVLSNVVNVQQAPDGKRI